MNDNDAPVELNLARHITKRFNLAPPLTHKIIDVVKVFADVRVAELPLKVDGACLKRPKTRPIILINKKQIETRKLFTIAHELGHVLIPTHYGDILDESVDDGRFDYSPVEAQANRFASELLLPVEWCKQFVETTDEPGKLLTTISKRAKVSLACAAYRLPAILGTGYVFAELSTDNRVKAAISTEYGVSAPSRGSMVKEPEARYKSARNRWSFERQGSTYWWWQFESAKPLKKTIQTASDVLKGMLVECQIPQTAQQSFTGSIGGLAGRAAGTANRDKTVEYGVRLVKEAFRKKAYPDSTYEDKNRAHYQKILKHPRIDEYLHLLVTEVIKKAYWLEEEKS